MPTISQAISSTSATVPERAGPPAAAAAGAQHRPRRHVHRRTVERGRPHDGAVAACRRSICSIVAGQAHGQLDRHRLAPGWRPTRRAARRTVCRRSRASAPDRRRRPTCHRAASAPRTSRRPPPHRWPSVSKAMLVNGGPRLLSRLAASCTVVNGCRSVTVSPPVFGRGRPFDDPPGRRGVVEDEAAGEARHSVDDVLVDDADDDHLAGAVGVDRRVDTSTSSRHAAEHERTHERARAGREPSSGEVGVRV